MFAGKEGVRKKQTLIAWLIIFVSYHMVWLMPFFSRYPGKGDGTALAESMLRDSSQFKWYVIPLLMVVILFYLEEARKKNWSAIMAGFAFFLMDAFNETWNGLFYTASKGYAAVWQCAYPSAWQPLMGWNIEIIFMFLIMGLASTKLLPADKDKLIFGKINNRQFYAFILAWLCVIVEIVLNLTGALKWNYPWWQARFPLFIFLVGYWPFFQISFLVYDMPNPKQQRMVLGFMACVLILSWAIFIPMGWI